MRNQFFRHDHPLETAPDEVGQLLYWLKCAGEVPHKDRGFGDLKT